MNTKFKFASFVLAFALALGLFPLQAFAMENGTYTCKVTTHYAHPETGVIEDSGGESSMKIGQSMTEGAVSPDGLFEQTAQGAFATVRFVLMDAVSDVSFFVNDKAVAHQITQEGTNAEGKTYADLRLQVPNDKTVIKCKMYVEPMDRYVVFFMTVSDFKAGNGDFKTDAKAQAPAANDAIANAQTDALSQIEALANIDTSQRDLFVASVKGAKTAEDVKTALDNALKADETAKLENALGEAKSAAFQKVDEMNLAPEKTKELKQKIKDAKTPEEVEAILKGESSTRTMVIAGGVAVAVVVVAAVVMKKKKSE